LKRQDTGIAGMPEIVALKKAPPTQSEATVTTRQAENPKKGKQKLQVSQLKNPLTHEDIEMFNTRSRQMLDLFNSTYDIVRQEHPELSPDQAASVAQMTLINSMKVRY